jgi:hypothetical protein
MSVKKSWIAKPSAPLASAACTRDLGPVRPALWDVARRRRRGVNWPPDPEEGELVYYGPGKRSWEDVPDPRVPDPEDVDMRVDGFTICGTDLHILRGDVPEVQPGRVLGHEAVGTVTEAGSGVRTVQTGDRVVMSCISACGRCRFCREGR